VIGSLCHLVYYGDKLRIVESLTMGFHCNNCIICIQQGWANYGPQAASVLSTHFNGGRLYVSRFLNLYRKLLVNSILCC